MAKKRGGKNVRSRKGTTVITTKGLTVPKLYDTPRGRRAANRRARNDNAVLNFEAIHRRTAGDSCTEDCTDKVHVPDPKAIKLPAYGWGETAGELPGWKSPSAVNPSRTYRNGDDAETDARVKRQPLPANDDRKITRSFVPDSRFCIDRYCGAQLQDGRCPIDPTHKQKRNKP